MMLTSCMQNENLPIFWHFSQMIELNRSLMNKSGELDISGEVNYHVKELDTI